jgi:hypothetical protein
VISRVLLSGVARATAPVPIIWLAPGRFSMIIVVLCANPTRSANRRASVSTGPPGGNGTTILIVRAVWGNAAWLEIVATTIATAPAVKYRNLPHGLMIFSYQAKAQKSKRRQLSKQVPP